MSVTAAEMTDALVQVNDRLAAAARATESPSAMFYCECGDCLAEAVSLSLDEHDEIRAREELIFAPGHDAPGPYRWPQLAPAASPLDAFEWSLYDSASWRQALMQSLIRVAPLS